MNTHHTEDAYAGALLALRAITVRLYGGSYSPRSERDTILADELYVIIYRHTKKPLPPTQHKESPSCFQ